MSKIKTEKTTSEVTINTKKVSLGFAAENLHPAAIQERTQNYFNYRKLGINNLQNQNFEGLTPEIGGVLCLQAEGTLSKKVTFERFVELLKTYILKTFGEGASPVVLKVIKTLSDPQVAFKNKEYPKMLADLKAGLIDELILKEKVK